MSPRQILIIGSVTLILITGVVGMLLGGKQEPVSTVARPTETPTAPPTISLTPGAKDEGGPVVDFSLSYPAIQRLPYGTPYWRVEIRGEVVNGKLPIDGYAFVTPGGDESAAMAKQRPFIEQWLTSIGQQPGTYELQMFTEPPHTY